MIDPARKPVQAPPAKPVVKPASTHGHPKRAWLVLTTFPCFNTSIGINTVSFRQLILSLSTYVSYFCCFFSRVWGDLSDIEKDMYTRHALNLICLDCSEVGADGFKHTHRC